MDELTLLEKIYRSICNTNTKKFNIRTDFDKQTFIEIFVEDDYFIKVYQNWVSNKYTLCDRPVPTRVNFFKPYTLDNTQILSYMDNSYKAGAEGVLHNINTTFKISDKPTRYILYLIGVIQKSENSLDGVKKLIKILKMKGYSNVD